MVQTLKVLVHRQKRAIRLFLIFLLLFLVINEWLLYEALSDKNKGEFTNLSDFYLANLLLNATLSIIYNITLIYSVNVIRNNLRNRETIIPNEKLVNIHIINFLLNSVFVVI